MDFFRSQDIARKNTVRLVGLFALSLISLIAITNIFILFALGAFAETINVPMFQRIDWRLFAYVSVAILAIVGFGSLYKLISLSGGGARIAEMMQGRLLVNGSDDLDEQRILNVVEEMAIASGTPVPPVYLLEEDAINAFAAGYNTNDAVIGITRGAIKNLSRDELQGVVAHEFSHILHGDMRLNIRLIGILHGIMVLGIIGYYLIRTTGHSRRSKDGNQLAVVGIGLLIIGYAGTFFGNLIKAAVSRQREFLADASAVQYTRNPDGIADALKRIGANASGSILENPGAAEISHSLFGNGVRRSFNSLFATHPPLEKRIKKIQPQWDGSYDLPQRELREPARANSQQQSTASGPQAMSALSALALIDSLMAQSGNVHEANLDQAKHILASIPEELIEAARDPFSARAIIYLLLLDASDEQRDQQLLALQQSADPEVFEALQALVSKQLHVQEEFRLPLVNVCLPVLRQLSSMQFKKFKENLQVLIQSDGRTSLWEWALQRVVLHQLEAVFAPQNKLHHTSHRSIKHLAAECQLILAFVLKAGRTDNVDESAIYQEALKMLEIEPASVPARESMSISQINAALDTLVHLKPLQKPAFLKACAIIIAADGVASTQELEVFRAIAATLDCPIPPIPLQTA